MPPAYCQRISAHQPERNLRLALTASPCGKGTEEAKREDNGYQASYPRGHFIFYFICIFKKGLW
jgi:hypothetical protein